VTRQVCCDYFKFMQQFTQTDCPDFDHGRFAREPHKFGLHTLLRNAVLQEAVT